jgi:hypothetical protein
MTSLRSLIHEMTEMDITVLIGEVLTAIHSIEFSRGFDSSVNYRGGRSMWDNYIF